jgi:hypothetical protein
VAFALHISSRNALSIRENGVEINYCGDADKLKIAHLDVM